jgi:hypothetical protein
VTPGPRPSFVALATVHRRTARRCVTERSRRCAAG